MKTYVGVDLGGTNIRVALIDEKGNVLDLYNDETQIEKGPDQVVEKLIGMIGKLDLSNCNGIGLGVPGPVDEEKGTMIIASNLPGFEGYPMAKAVQDKFQLPTYLINDGNAAGLAEALVGAGEGLPRVVYVTVSTGIGAAIILDGQVYGGKHGFSGEVGNIITNRKKERINNLSPGALESEASGTALVRKGKAIFGDKVQHAGNVFELADDGNKEAQALVDDFIEDLAQVLAAVGHVLDPDMFVFGGGVMKAQGHFFRKLKETYDSYVHAQMRDVEFALAKLGEPGIIGAAMQPMSKEGK